MSEFPSGAQQKVLDHIKRNNRTALIMLLGYSDKTAIYNSYTVAQSKVCVLYNNKYILL